MAEYETRERQDRDTDELDRQDMFNLKWVKLGSFADEFEAKVGEKPTQKWRFKMPLGTARGKYYREDGKRVLFVSTRPSMNDIETKSFMNPEDSYAGRSFYRLLNRLQMREGDEPRIRKFMHIYYESFNAGGVTIEDDSENDEDSENNAKDVRRGREKDTISDKAKAVAQKLFKRRFATIARKFKPDVIVILDSHLGHTLFGDGPAADFEAKIPKFHSAEIGRVRKLTLGDDEYKCVVTLPFTHVCRSPNRPESEDLSNLVGFVYRAIETALYGRNRYKISGKNMKQVNVDTIEKFDKMIDHLVKVDKFALDFETKNLNRVANKILTAQFGWSENDCYFLPIDHRQTPFSKKERKYIKRTLKWFFEYGSKAEYMIGHNLKFEVQRLLGQLKVRFTNIRLYDLMAAEHHLDENRKFFNLLSREMKPGREPHFEGMYSLLNLALGYGSREYFEGRVSKSDREDMDAVELKYIRRDYGWKDVVLAWQIHDVQIAEAKRRGPDYARFVNTVTGVMSDIIYCLAVMEFNGSLTDKKYLMMMTTPNAFFQQELRRINEEFQNSKAAQEANEILIKREGLPEGEGLFNQKPWLFDISKYASQKALFFEVMDLEPLSYRKMTKKDLAQKADYDAKGLQWVPNGKTNKPFQRKYGDRPEVKLLKQYNGVTKAKGTFITGILKRLINDEDSQLDSRLRTAYSFISVLTGRISSTDPNKQQIPTRGPLAKAIKRQFISMMWHILVKADYSAHEVKNWGLVAHDNDVLKRMKIGQDIRRQIRVHFSTDFETWAAFKEFKGKNPDFSKKNVEVAEKRKMVAGIKNKRLRHLASLHVDLEEKGDPHKLNYEFFFGVPAAKVTPTQRQNVKGVVFGVIYGKGAAALGRDLFDALWDDFTNIIRDLKDKIREKKITEKDAKKEALREIEANEKKIEKIERQQEDEKFKNEAKSLLEKLHASFKRGSKYIKKTIAKAREKYRVVSPIGRVRHLWGYLHWASKNWFAQDRRGPNSDIQGLASDEGFIGGRELHRMVWKFLTSKGQPFSYLDCNAVHDSKEAEVGIVDLPLALYLLEHALTTRVHAILEKKYNFPIITDLEIDIDIGPSLDTVDSWNWTVPNMLKLVETSIEWQEKELGYKYKPEEKAKLLKTVKRNALIIDKYRVKEIQNSLDTGKTATKMLITPDNVHDLGLTFFHEAMEESNKRPKFKRNDDEERMAA